MEFRIGTFNLRNLTLPNFRFYENLMYTEEEYLQKCAWSIQQLKNMDAPLVAFQEVFHLEPLEKICIESGVFGTTPHIICPSCDEDEPRVALASAYPIQSWTEHIEFPEELKTEEFNTFRRPFIEAIVQIPATDTSAAKKIRIFAVHLKSKRPLLEAEEDNHNIETVCVGLARALNLRAQEAIALRHLINQNLDIPTIVLGDFNDSAYSVTSQIIRGPYLSDIAPEEVYQKFAQARLENTHEFARKRNMQDVHYTYVFNGLYETVDLIFVSRHFYPPTGRILHYQTYTDHLIDRYGTQQPKHTSDHGQVVTTLALFDSERT